MSQHLQERNKLLEKELESKNRELEIEASLERVREKAMAMRASEELNGLIGTVFIELTKLDLVLTRCVIMIYDTLRNGFHWWMANSERPVAPMNYFVKDTNLPFFNSYLKGWQERTVKWTFELEGENKIRVDDFLFTKTELSLLPDFVISGMRAPEKVFLNASFNNFGNLTLASLEPLPDEHFNIMLRFAKVFDLTYTRFNDLQKAEAQAREAQIEATLERVRSKAMAMHSSKDLSETIGVFYRELRSLSVTPRRCGIALMDKEDKIAEVTTMNTTEQGDSVEVIGHIKMSGHKVLDKVYENWLIQKEYHTVLKGNEIKDYYQVLRPQVSYPDYPHDVLQYGYYFMFREGDVYAWTDKELSEEDLKIFRRFTTVISLTYKRYKDLQQAEAQAREAQIEAALERVRSRSMGMQKSEELKEVIQLVYEQFIHLNIHIEHTGFIIDYKERDDMHIWLADKHLVPSEVTIPYFDSPPNNSIKEAKEKGQDFFTYHLTFEEKNKFYRDLFKFVPDVAEDTLEYYFNCPGLAGSGVLLENIGLYIENFSGTPYNDEENAVLMRFGKVFQQTYTRFLDLQKAEAQAREGQIQLALERVRARTMAMQKSDELSDAVFVLFQQFKELDENPDQATIGVVNEDEKVIEYWVTMYGQPINKVFKFPFNEPNVTNKIYKAWKENKKSLVINLTGKALTEFMAYREGKGGAAINHDEKRRIINVAFFSKGLLNVQSNEERSQESIKLLERFASVFEQTYTRFLDLQKAEGQAKEATIETALEKVRSRTLAMQKSDELADTSAVLFKQLIHLGIVPNRLYIGIVHDNSGEIEFWITAEDGSKVSPMFSGNAFSNPSIKKMYDGWAAQKKSLVIDMQGKELQEYFHYLGEELQVPFKDGLSQKRRIQYLTYFSKGFIGMASPDEQPAETIDLLERFAYVFNLTFTRFNDLQIAEAHALQAEKDLMEIKAARKKAEETLTELQETQKQLIQSEKMASLGELTAGIAHEIQNPLNFVNNFSEVNKELIAEMRGEISKGNYDEVNEIAKDVEANEEKINHHGKRAADIVKGMLQHSRSSTGLKEPTAINALADEYLRLSYHGLRAKDKNFNAEMKTDFDETIGKINIIPQDIGRVLLNLYNNAFYACAERSRSTVNQQKSKNLISYEPTVSVTTKKSENNVIITVRDNGNGIPQKICDKIFQPFFTTKPTGQGTGLGLSLSYDILKAHGGEIKVETKEGERTEFIIQLPIKTNS